MIERNSSTVVLGVIVPFFSSFVSALASAIIVSNLELDHGWLDYHQIWPPIIISANDNERVLKDMEGKMRYLRYNGRFSKRKLPTVYSFFQGWDLHRDERDVKFPKCWNWRGRVVSNLFRSSFDRHCCQYPNLLLLYHCGAKRKTLQGMQRTSLQYGTKSNVSLPTRQWQYTYKEPKITVACLMWALFPCIGWVTSFWRCCCIEMNGQTHNISANISFTVHEAWRG